MISCITLLIPVIATILIPIEIIAQSASQNIITDNDIENKQIDEIKTLSDNPTNLLKLTNKSVKSAYENSDINKIRYLIKDLHVKANLNYFIDTATEEGNEDMAKFLVNEFSASPSLFAKQMALVNDHTKLVMWLDKYSVQRNNVSVTDVYRHYNKQNKTFEWNPIIAEKFQCV